MTTRCKFKCTEAKADYNNGFMARFDVVTDGSEENKQFFKYTPGGQLTLYVMAQQHFEVGKEYYVDVSEAPKPEGV